MMKLIVEGDYGLLFMSTSITISTWQSRNEANFRDPFFSEVELDELIDFEDPFV